MTKILLGALGLIIIGTGGYLLLRGSGPGDAAVTTAVNLQAASSTLTTNSSTDSTTSTNSGQATKNMDNITQATLHTTMGDITIEFFPQQAPKTVANFIKLASSGYYDGTKFHRVIKDFMDQGGDPLTKDDSQQAKWGMGGPGYQIPDEISSTNSNVLGSVAMANSGPNTNGSQFFINAKDNHFLDPNYTVFGHVVAGLDVVLAINKVPTGPNDRPVSPVIVTSVSVK